jgi:hypothetical protein
MALPHVYTFASLFNLATRSYSWRWDEAYKNSRQDALAMRRDCFLMGLLRERQLPVEQANWHIDPEDPTDMEQASVCEQLTKLVKKIPRLQQFKRAALEAEWYGRAAVQMQWGQTLVSKVQPQQQQQNAPATPNVAGSAGRLQNASRTPTEHLPNSERTLTEQAPAQPIPGITVVRHEPVNGDKVQYSWEGTPRILVYAGKRSELEDQGAKIVQTDRFTALELDQPYWRDRFLIHHGDIVDPDFFDAEMAGQVKGIGVRSFVYWMNWGKLEIFAWLMDFLERVGLGMTIFYYEEGNPQSRNQADLAAKEHGRNTRIVWPRSTNAANTGSGVERIEVPVSGAAFIVELMQYFDDKIERFIVGQSMSGGHDSEGSLGGSGRAKLSKDTKWRVIASSANNLDETLTEDLLGPLMRFNYPAVPFKPRHKTDLEDSDPEVKLEAGKCLVEMGVAIKTDEVRKAAGYSKPEPHDEVTEGMPMQPGDEGGPFGGNGDGKPGEEQQEGGQQEKSDFPEKSASKDKE